MSAIAGLLSINSGPSDNEWVSEYQETILVRNAKGMNNGATLFGLMSRLKNEPAETVEFKWFERDPVSRVVYQDGAIASTTVTTGFDFTLTSGGTDEADGLVQVGTVLKNDNTDELVQVTAGTGNDYTAPFTVQRGFGGTTPINVGDNNAFVIITLGQDEGDDPVESVFEKASTLTNYIQTFNSRIRIANAFKGSRLRTDIQGPLRERRVQALERVARDIELAYFLGEADQTLSGNGGRTYTSGIKEAVDTNGTTTHVLDGGTTGVVALSAVQTWLETFMTVGSENKLFMAGPKSYAAFSNFASDATNGFRITGQENIFGMNIISVLTPFGILDMAMHPLFKEISVLNDWGFVVDLSLVVQKVMEPLFLEPNIQTPGKDAYEEQFRAKLGLKLKFAEAFGYAMDFSGITG
jgi:hypothetical protein